jgi:hypothetical protein
VVPGQSGWQDGGEEDGALKPGYNHFTVWPRILFFFQSSSGFEGNLFAAREQFGGCTSLKLVMPTVMSGIVPMSFTPYISHVVSAIQPRKA